MAFTIKSSWPFATTASSNSRVYSFLVEGDVGVDDGDESYKSAMDAVESYVASNHPTTPDGLTPQNIDSCETLGMKPKPLYKIEMAYGNAGAPTVFESPKNGDVIFNMDVTAQNQRVNYALEHVAQEMAPGKTSPATEMISVDQLGAPQGVDIIVPTQSWSVEYYVATSYLTDNYKKNLENSVGKVNSAAFGYRAAGEVLCTGARLSKRGDDDWRISFSFAVRENRYGLTVSSFTVAGINIEQDVQGWDILDPIVEPQDGTGKVEPHVIGFNVLRVYERADLKTILGIPGF